MFFPTSCPWKKGITHHPNPDNKKLPHAVDELFVGAKNLSPGPWLSYPVIACKAVFPGILE